MHEPTLSGLSILVVEDEALLRKQIGAHLEKRGADVTGADTLKAARRFLTDLSFDFVLLDVNLPDGRGTDLLKGKELPADSGIIVMTAEGGVNGAVEAMRLGALDYLVKPFDLAELPLVIGRARQTKKMARLDEHRGREAPERAFFFGGSLATLENQLEKIITADNRMQERLSPVLIQGETGTGKTTVARWLHRQGPRGRSRWSRSTVRRCLRRWPSPSCSATNAGRSPTPGLREWDCSRQPAAALCFWTSCRACRSHSRQRYSHRLKTGKSGGWAAPARFPWTRASLPRATGT